MKKFFKQIQRRLKLLTPLDRWIIIVLTPIALTVLGILLFKHHADKVGHYGGSIAFFVTVGMALFGYRLLKPRKEKIISRF